MKIAGLNLFGRRGAKVAEHPDEDDEDKVAEHDDDDDDKVAEDDDDDKVAEDDDDDKVAEDDDDDKVADDDDDMPKSKASRKMARKFYARGYRAALKKSAMILKLCILAEKPKLADKFITKDVSVDDVRERLLANLASESSAKQISGLRNPCAGAKVIDTAAIYAKYNASGAKAKRA